MVNHSCLFKTPPPWKVALAPLLIFVGFLGSGFFTIFLITYTILILSTALFTISKHKPVQPVHDENLYEEEQNAVLTTPDDLEDMSKPQHDENQTKEANDHYHDHIVASQASSPGCDLSENDQDQSLDEHLSTSEDSEVGHDQSPDYSDGSISDEESLIEIALPSGHYVGRNYYKEEHTNLNTILHQKVPDLLPTADTIFGKRSLMELLAEINEMNEEENLIEIDISMGSIMCSRFEIEA
ncbi:hypothetical protein FNV43_RR12926 [Rhamnella rubrinervis]|uniref:Uncharacterized protein n=1 Tax=Rhamnella rubrinervis TaxID=2594499 RepID=A0A8K0H060_9ROSA|nr:hypothetical protein FNV43_RR12926 [Rhamnella rubrinervis]